MYDSQPFPTIVGEPEGADTGVPEPSFGLVKAGAHGGVAAPGEAYLDLARGLRGGRPRAVLHGHCHGEHGRSGRESSVLGLVLGVFIKCCSRSREVCIALQCPAAGAAVMRGTVGGFAIHGEA